jgi:hypothetical protein
LKLLLFLSAKYRAFATSRPDTVRQSTSQLKNLEVQKSRSSEGDYAKSVTYQDLFKDRLHVGKVV